MHKTNPIFNQKVYFVFYFDVKAPIEWEKVHVKLVVSLVIKILVNPSHTLTNFNHTALENVDVTTYILHPLHCHSAMEPKVFFTFTFLSLYYLLYLRWIIIQWCHGSFLTLSRPCEFSLVDFFTSAFLKALKINLFYSKKSRWSSFQKCKSSKVHCSRSVL